MATVHIRINGKEYNIACDDGQEEHLRFLADEVDDRVRSLAFSMGGNPGESMALLLIALTLADEVIEGKREMEKLVKEAKHLRRMADLEKKGVPEERMQEIEQAMATTLEDIAARIEKIARQIEVQ